MKRQISFAIITIITLMIFLISCQQINHFAENLLVDPTSNSSTNADLDATASASASNQPQPITPAAAQSQSELDSTRPLLPSIPASTIFEADWQDYTVFESGLISSEQAILPQFSGASVYHIALTISDDRSQLTGRQEVIYTNREETSLNEIYFHLYPNLLGGSSTISNLTVNGDSIAPVLAQNKSVLKVELPQPLVIGEAVVVGMDFAVSVPQTQDRNYGIFANAEDILAAAHFYPLIAVYDDQGWDIEIPSPQGDVVYADTSFYLVEITTAPGTIIVSSGTAIALDQNAGSQSMVFAAGPMRDYYFVATEKYSLVSETVGETVINSYYLPSREGSAALALKYAVGSVESFNQRYGIYPFTELDIVPTANLALGIEYPGIVAINQTLYDPDAKLGDWPVTVFFESTVVHEVGHQWFFSLVGNNQLAEPWVDESLTQYATWRYFLDTGGPIAADNFEQGLRARWQRLESARIPIGLPVEAYDGAEYSAIVYGRGPLFVAELAAVMGQDTLDQFLRNYALNFRWNLATAADFQQQAETHCACDLTDLFAEWVYE